MAAKIDTVKARDALKPRHAPYWSRVRQGCYVGFRKTSAEAPGSWVSRIREDSGKQPVRSLGSMEHIGPALQYDAAVKEAERWFSHVGLGGKTSNTKTVQNACEDYVKFVREDTERGDKRERTAVDLEGRFKRWVFCDSKFAGTPLLKLTKDDVKAWRRRLSRTDVRVNYDDAKPLTRKRSPSSVNRDMTALRSALNHAHDSSYVTSDESWRMALKPIKNADGRRDVYLDRDQRRNLIKHADADVALMLRGLSLLPLRPGALAGLNAGHFDKRLGVLTVGKDKAGQDRKFKLPAFTAQFIAEIAKDKLPNAPLLCRADGIRWNKDAWKGPVKAAARAAGLPEATTAYALRHSVITDLVVGGLDLLTVAQLSGTSVLMIERHYGHLRPDRAAEAMAGLAL